MPLMAAQMSSRRSPIRAEEAAATLMVNRIRGSDDHRSGNGGSDTLDTTLWFAVSRARWKSERHFARPRSVRQYALRLRLRGTWS
jgi:hypothetical protein